MTCQNGAPPLGLTFGNVSLSTNIISRGIGVGIGSPLQLLSLKPSTSTDYTWVYNAVDCLSETDWACINNWGGVYNSSKSRTYQSKTASTWNGTGLTIESDVPADSYIYFTDNVVFGRNGSVTSLPLLTRKAGYNNGGGLGIGANSAFLDQAVKTGSAPSKAWGMWVGSRSITNPVDGALWIGGYDQSRIASTIVDFPVTNNCESCVVVSDVTYQWPTGSRSLIAGTNSSNGFIVNLQPYTRYLQVPDDMFRNLIAATQTQGTYRANNGTLTFNRDAQMGNLSVTIQDKNGNPYKTVIPASELFFPPRGVDNNGVYTISNNSYLITMLYNTTYSGYVYDWGIPFLTMNYMIMDYEKKVLRMAPARQGAYSGSQGALVQPLCSGVAVASNTPVLGPSSTATPSPSVSADSGSGGSSTNVGAIAGGVVGGVAGLIIIAVLAWFLLRSKKKQKALKNERDAAVANGSEPGNMQERMSNYTATSPTEVSSVYAGGKGYQHNNPNGNSIDQWLHTQKQTSELGSPEPHHMSQNGYAPTTQSQNTTSYHSNGPHTSANMANMNEPFEMPAYQYK